MDELEVKDYLVSGTTKSGIAYTVDTRVRSDSRFLHLMVRIQNKKISDFERAEALFSLLGLLFGGDDGLMVFENEVANHHDGVCATETLMNEFTEILEAINAKN
jgi:hypothetical protein